MAVAVAKESRGKRDYNHTGRGGERKEGIISTQTGQMTTLGNPGKRMKGMKNEKKRGENRSNYERKLSAVPR